MPKVPPTADPNAAAFGAIETGGVRPAAGDVSPLASPDADWSFVTSWHYRSEHKQRGWSCWQPWKDCRRHQRNIAAVTHANHRHPLDPERSPCVVSTCYETLTGLQ
jgi:hypothetical protein